MSSSFEFKYHPIDHNGFTLPKRVLIVTEFTDTDHIINTKLKGLPWFNPKARDGHWPDSIAKRLGLLPYTKIEMFRRSKEWHEVVDDFDFTAYLINSQ